jgi:hypothetical protein
MYDDSILKEKLKNEANWIIKTEVSHHTWINNDPQDLSSVTAKYLYTQENNLKNG